MGREAGVDEVEACCLEVFGLPKCFFASNFVMSSLSEYLLGLYIRDDVIVGETTGGLVVDEFVGS